jgi:hypothetical protein
VTKTTILSKEDEAFGDGVFLGFIVGVILTAALIFAVTYV